jgi:hypothetical protein
MRTGDTVTHLHFDCFSGVSGDMLLGALVDAGVPLRDLVRGLKAVPVEGYALRARSVRRNDIGATKVDVVVRRGFHAPLSLNRILRILKSSRLPASVVEQSREVFNRLARAEGMAHRRRPSDVHFHEVGVVDSLVDVVGTVLGCHLLGAERISASAVNVGAGLITSAHGSLPVPGPAVAALAKGLPVYAAGPVRELSTPTGVALLGTLAMQFGPLPVMRIRTVGYGAGEADPPMWPNVLRLFVGDMETDVPGETDAIVQIETNLDDLNPQAYETVVDRLFSAGALDVTLAPVIMKAGRPGIVLTALAAREQAEAVSAVVLRETTTLGVRWQEVARRVLPRRFETVRTTDGLVRVKLADAGDGRLKAAPEYRDCRRIADRTGRPVHEIMAEAMRAFETERAGKRKKKKGKSRES